MKTIEIVLGCVLLAGCSTMPGDVNSTKAMLDGERQIQVHPGWLYAGGMKSPSLKLGGFWSEKSPDAFNLEVLVPGVEPISAVKIGLDGEVVELKISGLDQRHDRLTPEGAPFNVTVARCPVSLDFVQRMVGSKKVVLRMHLAADYVEGVFSFDQLTYARPAFRKALKQIPTVSLAKE